MGSESPAGNWCQLWRSVSVTVLLLDDKVLSRRMGSTIDKDGNVVST